MVKFRVFWITIIISSIGSTFFNTSVINAANDQAQQPKSCSCTIKVDGTGCTVDQTINYNLGTRVTVGDIINEVSFFDCPFKAVASSVLNVNQSYELNEANCARANLGQGNKDGYNYSVSCRLSNEKGVDGTGVQESQSAPNKNKELPPVELINPIGGTKENPRGVYDMRVIMGRAVQVTLGFLGSFTLLVFFYGGYMWLVSAGNSDRVQKGTKTMMYAVIGLFIIFGAYGILSTVIRGIRGGASGGMQRPVTPGEQADACQVAFEECIEQADRTGGPPLSPEEIQRERDNARVTCEEQLDECRN